MVAGLYRDGNLGYLGELAEATESGGGKGCRYGFFSRWGGVSSGAYETLNIGLHVEDYKEDVLANRQHLKNEIGASTLLSTLQVHGTRVYRQTSSLGEDLEVDGYDALVTDQVGVALMVQHADCQPVLLYDSVAGAVAAVHSGWRGSVQNILAKVVLRLKQDYGSDPKDIKVMIGPSLGPCCAEFVNYKEELPEDFHAFKKRENHFDFWKISENQLLDAGLTKENIEIIGQCTCCSADYFSYRRAVRNGNGTTGRNGSVIMLVP